MTTKIQLCECNCGQPAPIAKQNHARSGHIKGQPVRFIKGHNRRRLLDNNIFSRLTVIRNTGKIAPSGDTIWLCLCVCGNTIEVRSSMLLNRHVQSCGCLDLESKTTHGMYYSPEYGPWSAMKMRCTNPSHVAWKSYGGATPPVTVCPEWMTFEGFFASMGHRPVGTSLGRILDRGNYEPGNAFWMTQQEQTLARRNNNALRKWTETL